MGSLTDYGETAAVNHATTNQAYTPAATVFLCLAKSNPGEAATGASAGEIASGGGYARTAITFGAANTRRVTQNANVVFPEATADWDSGVSITHWFIADDGDYGEGNVLAYGQLGTPFAVLAGHTRTIPSGEVYIEFTASTGPSDYFANGFLDRMFRNQAFTVGANFWGLVNTAPTDASTGATIDEVVDDFDYARVEINEVGGASPAWAAAASSVIANANALNFGPPNGGSWDEITNAVLLDSGTHGAGNMLWYVDIPDQTVGTETTQIGFPAGQLTLAVS